MSKKYIYISLEQMKRLARYDLTFDEIFGDVTYKDADIKIQGIYTFTLEDLLQALKNIRAGNPTARELGEHWYHPLSQLYQAFSLEYVFQPSHPETQDTKPILLLTDEEYSTHIWQQLEDACYLCDDEATPVGSLLPLDEMINDFYRFLDNHNKPISQRVFSDDEMIAFISGFEDEEVVESATNEMLFLGRKFIDILCEKDNDEALLCKGYACYGGNRLYPCDWQIAHDCIKRLYDKTKSPEFANTLGYIYYYGRVSNGMPDYEKAFHYFAYGATNGVYESIYKLGDMFHHGYACTQNDIMAKGLYNLVYTETKRVFLNSNRSSFADAALRMGHVYAQGIGVDIDPETAYYHYLEAEYAAKLRASESTFFGDSSVVDNAQQALSLAKQALPASFFEESDENILPEIFVRLCEDNYRCKLSIRVVNQIWVEITSERIPTQSVPSPLPILITLPEISFSKKFTSFSIYARNTAQIHFCNNTTEVIYDYCCFNLLESRYEFFYDNQVVAWIKSDSYHLHPNRATYN